jgi:hypothetical protein
MKQHHLKNPPSWRLQRHAKPWSSKISSKPSSFGQIRDSARKWPNFPKKARTIMKNMKNRSSKASQPQDFEGRWSEMHRNFVFGHYDRKKAEIPYETNDHNPKIEKSSFDPISTSVS